MRQSISPYWCFATFVQ